MKTHLLSLPARHASLLAEFHARQRSRLGPQLVPRPTQSGEGSRVGPTGATSTTQQLRSSRPRQHLEQDRAQVERRPVGHEQTSEPGQRPPDLHERPRHHHAGILPREREDGESAKLRAAKRGERGAIVTERHGATT